MESPGVDQVNPFKQYQRKRGGKVGQSFGVVLVADGETRPTYSGDIMLAGWGDSSDKGQWVSFWIDESADLHPFAGHTCRSSKGVGQHYGAAFVLTEEPGGCAVNMGPSIKSRSDPSVRKLSSDAHLIVTGPFFCQYLEEKSEYTQALHAKGEKWTPETSKRYVKWLLKIESLSDLDRMPEKAKLFHETIRLPFSKWNGRE